MAQRHRPKQGKEVVKEKQELAQAESCLSIEQSMMAVKFLLETSLGCLTYLRALFPENNYEDALLPAATVGRVRKGRRGAGITVKRLTRGRSEEADCLLDYIEHGVYDALERNYLSSMIVALGVDPDQPNDVLETWTFNFTYESQGEALSCHPVLALTGRLGDVSLGNWSKKDLAAATSFAPTVRDVRAATQSIVRSLIVLSQSLNDLPSRRRLTIKLLYNESAPDDYEPPCFRRCDCEKEKLLFAAKPDSKPDKVKIGALETGHHRLGIHLASMSREAAENPRQSSPGIGTSSLPPGKLLWDGEADAEASGPVDKAFDGDPVGVRKSDGSFVPLAPRRVHDNPMEPTIGNRQQHASPSTATSEDVDIFMSKPDDRAVSKPEDTNCELATHVGTKVQDQSHCRYPFCLTIGPIHIHLLSETLPRLLFLFFPPLPEAFPSRPSAAMRTPPQVAGSPPFSASVASTVARASTWASVSKESAPAQGTRPDECEVSRLDSGHPQCIQSVCSSGSSHATETLTSAHLEGHGTSSRARVKGPCADGREAQEDATRSKKDNASVLRGQKQRVGGTAPRVEEDPVHCDCGDHIEDGFMINCEECACWMHAACYGIASEDDVPLTFQCYAHKLGPESMLTRQQEQLREQTLQELRSLALLRRAIHILYSDRQGWPGNIQKFAERIGCTTHTASRLRAQCLAEGFLSIDKSGQCRSGGRRQTRAGFKTEFTVNRERSAITHMKRAFFSPGQGEERRIMDRWLASRAPPHGERKIHVACATGEELAEAGVPRSGRMAQGPKGLGDKLGRAEGQPKHSVIRPASASPQDSLQNRRHTRAMTTNLLRHHGQSGGLSPRDGRLCLGSGAPLNAEQRDRVAPKRGAPDAEHHDAGAEKKPKKQSLSNVIELDDEEMDIA